MLFNVLSLLPGPQTFQTVSYPIATGEPVVIATYKASHQTKLSKIPPPTLKPAYVAHGSKNTDCNKIAAYAASIGASQGEVKTLVYISHHESRCRQVDNHGRQLKNPRSSASGVFQFLDSSWKDCRGHKTDWTAQTRCALKIIRQPNGAYNYWFKWWR